jgi:hypothetical protein
MNMGGFEGRMGAPLASSCWLLAAGFWLLAGIAGIWIGSFRTFWVMAERKVPPIDPRWRAG